VPSRAEALLAWGAAERRDLPWRRTRDPWAILVAELMLQQTQVTRVEPRWHQFLERFPDPSSCAAAPVAALIEEWAGLGYNRRAVNLHRCATAIVERHEGQVPDTIDELGALPGIGPYTARAVLAFAFECDVGVVDTNVGRLLARWDGRRLGPAEAQRRADAEVPEGEGWAWNQTMFDLAVAICTSRVPRCDACPVSRWCAWRGDGPDPAIASAGVSHGQSRFEGSDRQGRGRLLTRLRHGSVPIAGLADAMGWPDDDARAERVASTLLADGLAELADGRYQLPEK
jgi:A/G-specific adenine glycosylase